MRYSAQCTGLGHAVTVGINVGRRRAAPASQSRPVTAGRSGRLALCGTTDYFRMA